MGSKGSRIVPDGIVVEGSRLFRGLGLGIWVSKLELRVDVFLINK